MSEPHVNPDLVAAKGVGPNNILVTIAGMTDNDKPIMFNIGQLAALRIANQFMAAYLEASQMEDEARAKQGDLF